MPTLSFPITFPIFGEGAPAPDLSHEPLDLSMSLGTELDLSVELTTEGGE